MKSPHFVQGNHQYMAMQQDILNLLVTRQGHFSLESGHHGSLWLDLERLFLRPKAIQPFTKELAHKLSRYNIAAVCGPLIGGGFLAQTIASELGVEFYYTERFMLPQPDDLYSVKYRLPDGLRRLVHGKDVAIIDDVINAGSAMRGTYEAMQSCGANPVAIGALLVLGLSASSFCSNQKIPLEYIACLPNDIWLPSECPLCASRIPLEDIK